MLIIAVLAINSISNAQAAERLIAGNHGNRDNDNQHKHNNGVFDQDKTESRDNAGQGKGQGLARRIRLTFDEGT